MKNPTEDWGASFRRGEVIFQDLGQGEERRGKERGGLKSQRQRIKPGLSNQIGGIDAWDYRNYNKEVEEGTGSTGGERSPIHYRKAENGISTRERSTYQYR